MIGLRAFRCFIIMTVIYSYSFLVFAGTSVSEINEIKPAPVFSDSMGTTQFLQMFLGLSVVILFILGLAWIVKRMNNYQIGLHSTLKIIHMISLSQREKIVLMQVGKQQLLIGVAPGQVQTLLVLDEPVESDSTESSKISFSERLAVALKRKATQI